MNQKDFVNVIKIIFWFKTYEFLKFSSCVWSLIVDPKISRSLSIYKYCNSVIKPSPFKKKFWLKTIQFLIPIAFIVKSCNKHRMTISNFYVEKLFKDKIIHFHGYNGGGLDLIVISFF